MAELILGVMISGRGSNLQALIDACASPDYPARIAIVIANIPGAGGLARAEAAGIPTATIAHRDFPTREGFESEISAALKGAGVELVCLAGFMRLLTPAFVETWRDRLINIHPSLLPAYKGLDSHARALADGVRFTGCTVHFVRPEMDVGPIVAQAAVPVLSGDDEDALAARVLAAEHRCYPLAVRLIAEGRVRISDERALIDRAATPDRALFNPAED
ncbi:MAG: phosphoribosylglycinamide formyltransferase [Proteobacteria bacterium]|nr:phosphoribosylglycinamide formyltransferase [Pseudomonadota bacterium]